ncbi:hypothetical protein GGX14DRAFT_544532, partial [Mycena pura]
MTVHATQLGPSSSVMKQLMSMILPTEYIGFSACGLQALTIWFSPLFVLLLFMIVITMHKQVRLPAMSDPQLVPFRLETIRIAFYLRFPRGRGKPPEVGGRVARGRGRGRDILKPPKTSTLPPELGERVNAALHTQIGDCLRLQEHDSGVLSLLQAIEQDLPSGPGVSVSHVAHTGQRGRPRIELNFDFLSFGSNLREPTGLAAVAGVSSRTVCQRLLDYGLVQPAAPVYTETLDEGTGDIVRTYTSSTAGPVSNLTDDELDQRMHDILEIFPTFGRGMIAGHP